MQNHTIPQDERQQTLQSLQRIVLEETQGGRVVIRNLVSILNGEDPDARPSHRLQCARILLGLGFDEAREALAIPKTTSAKIQSPLTDQEHAPVQTGNASEISPDSQPTSQPLNPEHERLNKRLVARIRVDSEGGASIVRVLLDILEGNDPDAKTRDRIESAKVLLQWGFANPAQPDPEFMMFYAPCHPDCLCACKDLPEDHPDVVKAHTPLTAEQRADHEKQAEFNDKTADSAKRRAEIQREWQLEQTYSPSAVDARRLEREERRKRSERKQELKREREQEQKRMQKPEVVRHRPTEQEIVEARIQAHKRNVEHDKQRMREMLRREKPLPP